MSHFSRRRGLATAYRLGLALLACAATAYLARGSLLAMTASAAGRLAASNPASAPSVYLAMSPLGEAAIEPVVFNAASSEPGVADQARITLAAWLDLWRSHAIRDGGERLERRSLIALGAIEQRLSGMTKSGGKWARWYTSRVADAAESGEPPRMIAMIGASERLGEILQRSRFKPDPAAPTAAVETIAVEPAPPERSPAESRPPNTEPTETAPQNLTVVRVLPVAPGPPPVQENDPQGELPWRQAGVAAEPEPHEVAQAEPITAPVEEDAFSQQDDKQLLRTLWDNAELFSQPATTARGPSGRAVSPGGELSPEQIATREALARELVARGYRGVSIEHIRQLLSDDSGTRVALARRLLIEGADESARLLLLLAQDDSADVRAEAILVLGSSRRRELVETAWRLALRDKDPRVGRLAERLRGQIQ